MSMTMDASLEEMLEVNQEEPKEEPVYDIVLPNSTSYGHSIAGGGGLVIEQEVQSCWVKIVKVSQREQTQLCTLYGTAAHKVTRLRTQKCDF